MLLSTLRKLSSLLFLFATTVWADSVLIIHQNYSSVHSNVGGRLTNEGHTVTYSTSEVNATTIANYNQVWDVRYSSLSSTQASVYNTFVQNGGFLYLVTENPSCCGTRNTAVANMISSMGGGSGLTIGGSAGSTSNNITQVNTTYMTALSSGTYITFAAGSNITNYGNGQWLFKDGANRVGGVMWIGGAGNLSQGYTGTVITVADVNWLDASRFSGTNITALDDIITGIVYGTVQGTIDASGTSGGGAAATPVYSSGITAAQTLIRNAFTGTGAEINADINGSNNDVYIHQAGTHYIELGIVGSSNAVNLEQASTQVGIIHYAETDIIGDGNTLDLIQSGDGNKTAFITVTGDNNIADIAQRDSGQHYLQLDLIGDGHDATVVQEGTGNHAATVELTNSGGAWTFDLTQSGSTDKEYSLPHSMSDGSTTSGTCYVAAGCLLTVIQQD